VKKEIQADDKINKKLENVFFSFIILLNEFGMLFL
tara:strand:- start:1438 stop:1542 length:105 start_codon:yes stop_codon:yes gene_type:complete